MITQKTCKGCGNELDISNFKKCKNTKDGYENKCKRCRLAQRKIYVKVCEFCNQEYETYSKKSKFCGSQCCGESKKQRIAVKCSFCNKDIEVIKSRYEKQNYHYCNKECMAKHLKIIMLGENNPNYSSVDYNCDGCHKTIKVEQYRIKNQKYIFCSNECHKSNIGKFFTGENNPRYVKEVTRECLNCGKSVTRKPYEFDINCFCSKLCSNQYNNKLKRHKLTTYCDYCGREIQRVKSKVYGNKSTYCSRECQHKGWSILYSGENSPIYNHNKPVNERIAERKYVGYYEWRKQVYKRDNYSCQCCGDDKGGNLVAHHILNYSEHKELRIDINNGITLCKDCHKKFHDTYGYTNNNKEQLNDFLKNIQAS